jgi:putative addiction module CopG family antidote
MKVELTTHQEDFIRKAVASGRFATVEAAVRHAISCWEEGERARIEVLAALDEAEADLEAGRYADYSHTVLPKIAKELKREAREFRARYQSRK